MLGLAAGQAHACLFVTSTPPEGWYRWAARLFAGDVSAVMKDAGKPLDVVTVAVVETFKGPDAARGTLTVHLSQRYWTNCRVERPEIGARVLVAMSDSGDTLLVPLPAGLAEQLRAYRLK